MNKCMAVAVIMILVAVVVVPATMAQPAAQYSPLPTPPWCEDVGNVQPCLPWRPTPSAPLADAAHTYRLYLPTVLRYDVND